MLQKSSTDNPLKALTPVQQAILAALLRRANSSPNYNRIGQPIPGISPKLKGIRLELAGLTATRHKQVFLTKDGLRACRYVLVPVKEMRAVDTRKGKQMRMIRRLEKGLPANA